MLASYFAKGWRVAVLMLWVLVAFFGAQFVAAIVFGALINTTPFVAGLNPSVQTTLVAALSYIVAFSLAAAVPITIGGRKPFREILGIAELPSWSNIGAAIVSVVPYFILTSIAALVIGNLIPGFTTDQAQEIPFQNLNLRIEYIVAFITLVILAPVAEELLFRGYLLGRMKLVINPWLSVVITAALFGALHLPGAMTDSGLTLQWSVAVDTFVLGLVLGSLRNITGNVWAGVMLHMIKNGIAFFYLFIYPLLTGTM